MLNGLPLAGLLANPSPCNLLGLARTLAATSRVWACLQSRAGAVTAANSAASSASGGRAYSASSASGSAPNGPAAAAPTPASVPVERLQRIITPQLCDSLRRNGYAVVDNVFGPETASALRRELAAVRGTDAMHKNCTHLVHNGATGLLEKEHIWEAELMLPGTQALAPRCAQLQNDATLRVMLSLLMPELSLQSQAIKLQWNAGQGGCFPMHFDSDMALDMRRVTAVWYLNPDWKPEDGGQLRVYPFPQASVDIAPLNDRMVLFSSMHLLHRVLPSAAERYCFTIWISAGAPRRLHMGGGGGGSGGGSVEAEREQLRRALSSPVPLGREEAWRLLMHDEIRKHAAKWHYRQEWEQSIRESHPEGQQLQQALATFHQEVAVIERALAPLLPALVAGPPPGSDPRPAYF